MLIMPRMAPVAGLDGGSLNVGVHSERASLALMRNQFLLKLRALTDELQPQLI